MPAEAAEATRRDNGYSHLKTRDVSPTQTTNTPASSAMSDACADQESPIHIPWSSDAARVSGSARATVCHAGGSASIGTNSPESPTIG